VGDDEQAGLRDLDGVEAAAGESEGDGMSGHRESGLVGLLERMGQVLCAS
jgi:hypothetical protein